MTVLSLPTQFQPEERAANRLAIALIIAGLLHIVLILGVSFSFEKPAQANRSLEVTVSIFKDEKSPEKADFIAQNDQQGSGTLEKASSPKTPEQALFQDTEIRVVKPESTPPPSITPPTPQKIVVANRPTPKNQTAPAAPKPQLIEHTPAPTFDRTQLSSEIASLEAELSQDMERYAKRPRISRQNSAATRSDPSAWYRDEWRKKVERIGNLNYPEEARRQKIYGHLRMLVVIKQDGTLQDLRVLESSGFDVLDNGALKIVRLAAPFAPFTGQLAREYDQVEIIRTWRFERGDRLSSQ